MSSLSFSSRKVPSGLTLLVARQMLVGKDQQRVLEPGGVERAPGGVVQLRDLDAADHGAEAGVDRFDIESACHVGPPG
jgi:hypothetical protein